MALTFANLESECYLQLGLDSSQQAAIDRWLSIAQNDICSRWPWSFMLGHETVVTVPDTTTGTVSVNAGSTTATFGTYTPTAADVGKYIQFQGENDWYVVSAQASPSITLATAYAQTTNLTAGTFILRKFFYSLSASADRIIDIRNWNTPLKLVQIDARTLDAVVPLMPATGNVYSYIAYGVDSSGNIQITPYPFPSDSRLLEVRTTTRPTDNAISIPNKYAQVMAWGGIAMGFAFLRKLDFASLWNQKYEGAIVQMKKDDRRSEDYQPILQSIDGFQNSTWQALPGSYPILP